MITKKDIGRKFIINNDPGRELTITEVYRSFFIAETNGRQFEHYLNYDEHIAGFSWLTENTADTITTSEAKKRLADWLSSYDCTPMDAPFIAPYPLNGLYIDSSGYRAPRKGLVVYPEIKKSHTGHKIITNSANGEVFKMCKDCCEEIFE
jgi:hypothetical protein